MNTAFRYLAVLPGLLFVISGIRWAVDPGGAAQTLGMSLQEGVGLSSQIGDTGAFFLAGGIMIFLGVIKQKAVWFLAPAMIVGLAAVYRVIAWAMHDAAFAAPMIIIELIITTILLLAAKSATDE